MKEQTGFADVDASGRSDALVDYMALDDPVHRRIYEALLRAMTRMIVSPHGRTRLRKMLVCADFMAALEDRQRAGTFFGSAVGYTVIGTKR